MSVSTEDFRAIEDFLIATVRNIRSLHAEQRHDGAARTLIALHRLVSTIRESEAVHGFSAILAMSEGLRAADQLLAEG